jgi:nucleoside 2-deoxyribosyltransferase
MFADQPPPSIDLTAPGRNVFLMTRFRQTAQHEAITAVISSVLDDFGVSLIRADWREHAELWSNVRLCMDHADYGIAVFETLVDPALSPNVSLELGYMLAKEKRCLLLREKGIPILSADLAGHLCREFDAERLEETIRVAVEAWLRELGIAKRAGERLLVFVSHGGTCRDPMAKAVTMKLLQKRNRVSGSGWRPSPWGHRARPRPQRQPGGPSRNFLVRISSPTIRRARSPGRSPKMRISSC